MAREHREKHKAHLDQHVRDARGEYHYIGDWYVIAGGKKAMLPCVAFSLLSAALLIAAGCLRFPGMMDTWYVILPYLGAVCLLFALFWQGGKLALSGGRVKTFVWEAVKDHIFPITRALAIAILLTGVLGGVYLLCAKIPFTGVCATYFLFLIAAAVYAWLAGNAFRIQKWSVEP